MTERYFAFGANVHPATLDRRGITPRRFASARLDGYRLVFDTPGIPWFEPAFASLAQGDDHVWGVLYELSVADLARLRSFEGSAYLEIGVEVESGGGRVPARTFVTAERPRERAPSRRYLRVIAEGARARALPEEWIARIESHPRFYLPVIHELWGAAFHAIDLAHRLLVPPSARKH